MNNDDFFKNKLENYEIKPNNKVWDNVQDELQSRGYFRNNNNINKYLILGGFMLLLSSFSIWFYSYYKETNSNFANSNNIKNKNIVNSDKELKSFSTKQNETPKKTGFTETLNNNIVKTNNKIITNISPDNIEKIDKNIKTNKEISQSKIKENNNIKNITKLENPITLESKNIPSESIDSKKDFEISLEIASNNTENKKNENVKRIEKTEYIDQSNFSKVVSDSIINKNQTINNDNKIVLNEETKKTNENISSSQPTILDKKIIDSLNKTKNLSWDLSFGMFNFDKEITAANSEYIRIRKDYEKGTVSFNANVFAKYNLKNFFFKTGLAYCVYNSQTNYRIVTKTLTDRKMIDTSNSYMDIDTIGWIASRSENLNFNPLLKTKWQHITDTLTIIDTTKNPLIYNNKNILRYFEIPIMIGYDFRKNKKLSVLFSSGISFGFYLSSKGAILSNNPEFIVDFNNNNIPFNNCVVNLLFSIGCAYKINDDISLLFTPIYKQNLSSIFKNSYPVNQKFKTFGINTGINIKI